MDHSTGGVHARPDGSRKIARLRVGWYARKLRKAHRVRKVDGPLLRHAPQHPPHYQKEDRKGQEIEDEPDRPLPAKDMPQ